MNLPVAGAAMLGNAVAVPSNLASLPPSLPGAKDVTPIPIISQQMRTTRSSNSVSAIWCRGKRTIEVRIYDRVKYSHKKTPEVPKGEEAE
jgi:hypothetical protein